MKLFLLIFLSYHVSSSYANLTEPECTKGSTFWCESLVNAKKCHAEQFCIQAVWEKQKFAGALEHISEECMNWVYTVREFDDLNDTESLTIQCSYLNEKNTCAETVSENSPQILDLLKSSVSAEYVCSVLNWSNASNNTISCSQCRSIENSLINKLQTTELDDVLTQFLIMCGEMSSYSDSCSSIVLSYFAEIYSLSTTYITNNGICDVTTVCSDKFKKDLVTKKSDDIPCQLCEQFVLHLRELLIANTSVVEFKNLLDGLCKQMGQFNTECTTIVEQYYVQMYQYLSLNLNASKACVMIGICKGVDNSRSFPNMPLVAVDIHPMPKQQTDNEQFWVNLEVDEIRDEMLTSIITKTNEESKFCVLCEYVMHFVQEDCQQPKTKEEIEDIVYAVCNKLPKIMKKQCVNMIELYGDKMVSLLVQSIDARHICPTIKLCPPDSPENVAVIETKSCPLCLFAIQELLVQIDNQKTKQNIELALSKLCNHLTDKMKNQCTQFVVKYSTEIIEMIIANFTPQEICTYLKLCSDSTPSGLMEIEVDNDIRSNELLDEPIENEIECKVCVKVVEIVESRLINTKKTKEEIRRELRMSCDKMKRFSRQCKEFVDKYANKVVDLIFQGLAPKVICTMITVCSESNTELMKDGFEVSVVVEKAIASKPQCVLCEFIMEKLEEVLKDKKTDEEIKHEIRSVCEKMPRTLANVCAKFVDEYFMMIVAIITTTNPKDICASLEVCESIEQNFDLLDVARDELVKCSLCRGILASIESVVENPFFDRSLERMEERACNSFASSYVKQCVNLVKLHGSEILDLLRNFTDNDEVCFKIKVCSSGQQGLVQMT